MVIFQYNLYIFWIHLRTVLYPKLCYNESYYKEVVVYIAEYMVNSIDFYQMLCSVVADLGLHYLLRPVCPNT